ncbi:unnamed protein product [Diabrotica balteata]|uniref:Uncharacterized protein n=1 Tax=Diabrotica balteata TaxID=107213 RepID=A0A9N9XJ63_DIABA|nr:unnamed protein product [Diabrotica balteata]
MNFKITLVFVALCMASAYTYPKSAPNSDGDIYILQLIVHAIEFVIDYILQAFPKFIEDIDQKWPDFHDGEVNITKSIVGFVFDFVNNRINTWSQNSTDGGKKLAKCITEARHDAVHVPVDFINKTLECSGDDFIAFVKTLPTLIEDLTEVQVDAERAANKIDKCHGNDISTVLCVLDVVSDLVDVVKILAIKTHNDIKPVADQWNVFVNSTFNCGKDNVGSYNVAGGKWLQKAYSYPNNVSDNPDDCIDIIKAIVYITEALIDLLLEYAPRFIDNIDEDWPDVHQLEVDLASGVIYTIFDIVDDRIQTWSENSTEVGKKLANCITNARDYAVPVDFINKTLECSGDDFIALVKTLPTLIDDLTDVQVDAKRAADKIYNCAGHDVSTALCVLDVVSELVDVAKILVIKTHNHIKPVADQWKVFVNSTINCGKHNIDFYNAAGGEWLQKVSDCVTA